MWREERDQIQAKVVLDSINPRGDRLTTIEVTCHRFVLAEFNTHRVFSRNSASSRAIPVNKQILKVQKSPAFPISWPREQKGMQGGEELTEDEMYAIMPLWVQARDVAVMAAGLSARNGLHKSVVNRLLEPFMWHTIIVTSTEWDGFWQQRCGPNAQPEIRVAAEAMKEAYDASTPEPPTAYWHTPYIQPEEDQYYWNTFASDRFKELGGDFIESTELRKRVSVARCARVSYLTHDGKRDIEADLTLYDRLVTAEPPHWSPLEHVATPCPDDSWEQEMVSGRHNHRGNFRGWDQLRHIVEAEKNKKVQQA